MTILKLKTNLKYELILFVLFFLYTFILTYNIPFFWEDKLFLDAISTAGYKDLIKQTIHFGTPNFSHPGEPLTILSMKLINKISGINYLWFRVFRSVIYGLCISLLFLLLDTFGISERRALFITITNGFFFPLFLTNFFVPRPEITGIAAKILGLSLFFQGFFKNKELSKTEFYLLQAISFITLLIAIKLVSPLYFLAPTLTLFILCIDYKLIKKYWLFLGLLLAINFPSNISTMIKGNIGTYTLSATNPELMLRLGEFSSFFPLNNLYYKTLPELVTPLGAVTIVFIIITLIYKFFNGKKLFDMKEKSFLIFMTLDFAFNFLIMFATPDPAARYMVYFMIPFLSMLIFLLFKTGDIIGQKKFKRIILLFLVFTCIISAYNISLSLLYRFTWGNAFIGMDETSKYIDARPGDKVIFYYSGSVANEYSPLKVEKCKFVALLNSTFVQKVQYSNSDINEMNKYKQQKKQVYLIKRVTATGRTEYPQIDFDSDVNFKLIKIIEADNSTIDEIFFKIINKFKKRNQFNNNIFKIYQYKYRAG